MAFFLTRMIFTHSLDDLTRIQTEGSCIQTFVMPSHPESNTTQTYCPSDTQTFYIDTIYLNNITSQMKLEATF